MFYRWAIKKISIKKKNEKQSKQCDKMIIIRLSSWRSIRKRFQIFQAISMAPCNAVWRSPRRSHWTLTGFSFFFYFSFLFLFYFLNFSIFYRIRPVAIIVECIAVLNIECMQSINYGFRIRFSITLNEHRVHNETFYAATTGN